MERSPQRRIHRLGAPRRLTFVALDLPLPLPR